MKKIYQTSLAFILCFLFLASTHAQRKTSGSIPGTKISKLPFNSTFNSAGITAGCDTSNLEESSSWTITYYLAGTSGKDGYVNGTNKYADKQKANFFDLSSTTYTYTTGCLFYFGKANSNKAANLSKNLIFRVYDVDADGLPGAQLGAAVEVRLSKIKSDVDGNFLTEIIYPTPIALPASKQFFVSVDISNFTWSTTVSGTRDSITLLGSTADDVIPGQGYEQWSDDIWYDMNYAWSGFNVALAIFPYVGNTATSCTNTTTCALATNLKAANITSSSAKLKWNAVPGAEGYTLRYKPLHSGNWISKATSGTSEKITGLLPGMAYRWEVKTFCQKDPPQVTSDGSAKEEFTTGTLSISDEAVQKISFQVYPVPAKDIINIQANGNASFSLVNQAGKVQLTKNINGNGSINVSGIAAGFYYLKNNNTGLVQKVVITR